MTRLHVPCVGLVIMLDLLHTFPILLVRTRRIKHKCHEWEAGEARTGEVLI